MNNQVPARVFLDTNILFDVLDNKAIKHSLSESLFNSLLERNIIIYVSPTSFAVIFYLISKSLKDKQWARKVILQFFSALKFSREDYIIMEKVMNSNFEDLEDAMQYFSAQDAGVDCIITNNLTDFPKKGVPVYSIENFFYQFLYH